MTSPTLERRLTLEAASKTASRAFYRARAHGYAGENFTGAEWLSLVRECEGRCLRCGEPDPTVDHVTPLCLGGSNTITNVQVLCASCNSREGGRDHGLPPRVGKQTGPGYP